MAKRHRSPPRASAGPRTAQVAKYPRPQKSDKPWFRALLICALFAGALLGTVLIVDANSSRGSSIESQVTRLLAGIPQQGQTLGTPTAPVTLQLFAELEDPSSDFWFADLLPEIIRKFVRTSTLKIEYDSFKTNTISSETFVKQQAAALAAGAQNKLWNYAYTFYYQQGKEYSPYVTETYLANIAHQVPALDVEQWHIDSKTDTRIERVVEEDQRGRTEGIHVTPAYRIGRTGGALKDFTGSKSVTYRGQIHPTTYASAEDIAKAIAQIHLQEKVFHVPSTSG